MSNEHPHCGTCSQCIDRRFAILAAGAAAHEPSQGYGVDLLVGERNVGESRTMLASYVEIVQQVSSLSEMEFLMRFGEVARIVRYLDGTAEQSARKVYELYKRHSNEVKSVIEEGLRQHASKILSRSLPDSCLLRLVHDPTISGHVGAPVSVTTARQQLNNEPHVFRHRGEGWEIRFDGHDANWFKASIGFAYLRELLRFPKKQVAANQLLVSVHGDKANIPVGDGGEDIDEKARAAYAEKFSDLKADLDKAKRDNDEARQLAVQKQMSEFAKQIKRSGFKGQLKYSKSDRNKIRNSVSNAVRRAIAAVEKYDAAAAAHLKDSVSLGYSLAYCPSDDIEWSIL